MDGCNIRAGELKGNVRRFRLHWFGLALIGTFVSILILLNAVPRNEDDAFSSFRIYGWPFKPAVIWLKEYMYDPRQIQWAADVVSIGEFHIALRYVALNLLTLILGTGLLVALSEFIIGRAQSRTRTTGSLGWFIRPAVNLRTLVILTLVAGALLYPYVSAIQESLRFQGHLNFTAWEVPILILTPVAILLLLAWLLERRRRR